MSEERSSEADSASNREDEEGRPTNPKEDPEKDRFVPSIGFVVAGFALASGFMGWTDAVAVGPVESVPAVVAGAVALVAFGARRYGSPDRRLSVLAGLGTGSVALAATVTYLYPVATTGGGVAVGPGIPVAFVLGTLGVSIALADYLGQDRVAFLVRSRFAVAALGIGVVGLLGGIIVQALAISLVPGIDGMAQRGIGTGAFSVGLGLVAVLFLVATDNDRSFLDVRWPSRRGWVYVVGGVVAMFAVLLAMGWVADLLGLPSAQHGLIEDARDDPTILLLFVPLSWLAIGPGEELLNRNIIQKYLYDGFSRPAAVVVATVVFTLIHLPAYATASGAAIFTTLIRLFGISLVLGVVYERTENVVVAALVHGTYNAIQFGLAYLALVGGYI